VLNLFDYFLSRSSIFLGKTFSLPKLFILYGNVYIYLSVSDIFSSVFIIISSSSVEVTRPMKMEFLIRGDGYLSVVYKIEDLSVN